MAEIQKADPSGEMTRRFIEFVMMQAQNAAMFLGEIPNPSTGRGEINLDLAKVFIDQLEMLSLKTRGNLSKDEEDILANTLTQLRLSFVRAGGLGVANTSPSASDSDSRPGPGTSTSPASESENEANSRKKFSKSYGS